MDESWRRLGTRTVHAWETDVHHRHGPNVVVLPGLGLPSYALPLAAALGRRGLRCAVLDLPGFGERGHRATAPDIEALGRVAAEWIGGTMAAERVIIVGHSTGAQAALTTALLLQASRPGTSLVMAGPTFQPRHRRLVHLLADTPAAYRQDSLREQSVLPDVARGRMGVRSILRSAIRDAPERRLRQLQLPLTVTAGTLDAYAPRQWIRTLRDAARQARWVRLATVPGSHNNIFTYPAQVADVVSVSLSDAA